MKLPKIPIDYSKSGSGEAPFDGRPYLLHFIDDSTCSGIYESEYSEPLNETVGGFFTTRKVNNAIWPDQRLGEAHARSIYSGGIPTHYTPMPEFVEGVAL